MSGFKKAWCILPVLLLIAIPRLFAQQVSPPLTLKQLLDRVSSNAPALLTDSAAILIRQSQAAEVRNNWLPNLRLNYQADIGTNNNVAGPYFGYGIIPSNSRGVREQSNTTATAVNLG
ncbi:MAG: TolC family protein, partial [Sphingobacteriaceae bacterium]